MQIRKLSESDIDEILLIENECFKDDPWSREMLLDSLKDILCNCLGVECDGKIVAYSIFAFIPNIVAEVYSIATLNEYQRKGFAKALFLEEINAAKAHGIREFTLEVRKSNTPAIKLYESLGFVCEAIRSKYYSDGEDAIIMWRRDN